MATLPTYDSGDHNGTGFAGRFLSLQTSVTEERTWITNRLAYHWPHHPESAWGDKRSEAVLLRAAVDFDIEKTKQAAGDRRLDSKSAGSWAKAYAEAMKAGTDSDAYYLLSPEYGAQYLTLQRETIFFFGVL